MPLGTTLLILAAATSPATGAGNGLNYERIIVTGDRAPGTAPGVVVSGFTGPYTHPEPGPRIDAGGRVAFFAHLAGPDVTPTNGSGIWSKASGQLSLVARAGEQAVGVAPGVLFRAFTEDFAPSAPAFGGGRTEFPVSLTGSGVTGSNSSGVWAQGSGGLQPLARTGSQAPGVPAGVVFSDPLYLADGFVASHALVVGNLTGPGVSGANGEGFWTDRSGTLVLLLREGNQAPGMPAGVVFGSGQFIGSSYTFPRIQVNRAGELAVQANLLGPGIDIFSNEAIYAERSGQFRLIMREGDHAPGAGDGATFGGNSVLLQNFALAFNSLGHVAFDCMLGGSKAYTTTIFSDHRGTLQPVVMPGDPAPGTDRGFGILVAPFLSDGGRIAFRAALDDAGMYPPVGLWWDQPGPVSALAIPGQQAPGRPAGVTFAGIHGINGFNAAGQLAFTGQLSDPVTGTFPMVLVLAGPSGEMRIVAQQDESFDVAGDGSDMRAVSGITAGGLSENGVLVFRLDFADGTSGIFTASVARPPGASGDLRVGKNGEGALLLSWSADCGGGTRYGIYRGSLGTGLPSIKKEEGFCTVAGMTASIPAGAGTADFFLVVPGSGDYEGSYGVDSQGHPRPPAILACYPQDQIDSCQP
jgi:hypothetical protein